MTPAERKQLLAELDALDQIEAKITEAREPAAAAIKPFNDALAAVEDARTILLDRHSVEIAGTCEHCATPVFHGEQGHRGEDAMFCAECAPTWGDCKASWDAETSEEMADDKVAFEQALKAHLDGFGSLTDQVLHPL